MVPASSVETAGPEPFHFRIFALRVDMIIWAYSSVPSPGAPSPDEGARDMRCADSREAGSCDPTPPNPADIEPEAWCARRASGDEVETDTLSPDGARASLTKIGLNVGGEADLPAVLKLAAPVGTAILWDRSRVRVGVGSGGVFSETGKSGAKADVALDVGGAGGVVARCSRLLCLEACLECGRDAAGECEDRLDGGDAGDGARVATGVFGNRASCTPAPNLLKPCGSGMLMGSPL